MNSYINSTIDCHLFGTRVEFNVHKSINDNIVKTTTNIKSVLLDIDKYVFPIFKLSIEII